MRKGSWAVGLFLILGLGRTGLTKKAQGWNYGGHMNSGNGLHAKAQARPLSESGQA